VHKIALITGMAYEAQIARKAIKDSGASHAPLVFVAGPAGPNAEKVVAQAVKQGVKGIISFGVCGALAPEFVAGQVVLPNQILKQNDKPAPYPDAEINIPWRDALLPVIEKDYFVSTQPLLSVNQPITSAQKKHQLYEQTGACAVDMESGILAALAKAQGLPFIAVRVVGDVANQSIPAAFDKVLKVDGELSIFELIKGLVTKWPGLTVLKNLSNNDGEARANLSGLMRLGLPDFELPDF